MTDLPPGTERRSDNVTERHTFGDDFGGPVSARRGRGPSRRGSPRRLHECTDARKTSPKPPFSPFSRPFGAASRRDGLLSKVLQHDEIRHNLGWAGRPQNRVRIGAPNLPHRFPRHVHYLRLKSRTQMARPRSRQRDVRRSRPKCGNGNILEDGPCLTGGRGRFYDEATFLLDEFSQGDSSCPGEPGEAC